MQLKHDFDGKIEQKFKHFSHSFSSQEKRIDKIANSIHSAVDQKFIKDWELKQQITTNLDERMEGFDKDMRNKLSDFHELISKKLVNLKNEVNEISQETKRNWQSMIEGWEVSNSSNFLDVLYIDENFNTKIEKLIKKTVRI